MICLLAGFLLIAPAQARADVINFNGLGRGSAVSTTLSLGGTTYVRNVLAGQLNWTWAATGQSFYAYCVDLVNYLQSPQTVSKVSSTGFTNGVVNGGAKAAWLFNTYAAAIFGSGSNTQAAALQVAIWEAMYDTTNSLTGGAFRLATTGAIRTQAQTYLNALYSGPGGYQTSVATILSTSRGQDQITRVPEPATLVFFGLGCAGAGFFVRRRTGKTQSAA